MSVLIRVYSGWTSADVRQPDWALAFSDSASADEIARELFNREHGNVSAWIKGDFQHFIDVVEEATKSNFCVLDDEPPGDAPKRIVEIELTS